MDEHNSDSRKKRRIAPLSFRTAQPIEIVGVESAVPDRTLNAGPPAESGAWDFLAKWEATDNTIIGDIEEEEYYSDVSSESPAAIEIAEHESEEGDDVPHEGPAARPSKLGTDKIIEIINDCIESYTKAWTPGKGETKHKDETGQVEVPVTYDALALWEDAEAAGQREQLADKYELEAEYYRQRLDKLCEEILKDPGDTVAGVQMKCRNLEVTVELLERATWLEEIYRLPPDTGSDDEAQDRIPSSADKTQAPEFQPTASAQHGYPYTQVIDLGTPSDSEVSEDERTLPVTHLTTPAQVNISKNHEQNNSAGRLDPDTSVSPSIETAGHSSAATPLLVVPSRASLSDAPENASFSTIRRWSWAQLEGTQDRKRIVSKAICELKSTDRDVIRGRLQKVGRANMVREIPACIDMLLHGEKRMPGILPQDLPKILIFTRLFLCWWLCGDYTEKEPSEVELSELKIHLHNSSLDPSTFCDYVDTLLSTTLSEAALERPTQPSQAEIVEISSDDDEPPRQLPHWRRREMGKPGKLRTTITID